MAWGESCQVMQITTAAYQPQPLPGGAGYHLSLLPVHTLPVSDLSVLPSGSSHGPSTAAQHSLRGSAGSRGRVLLLLKGLLSGSMVAKPWQWQAPCLPFLPQQVHWGSQEPALTHTWDLCQSCDKAKVRDVLSLASLNHQRIYARAAWLLPTLPASLAEGAGPGERPGPLPWALHSSQLTLRAPVPTQSQGWLLRD